jgi:hypothetical protein
MTAPNSAKSNGNERSHIAYNDPQANCDFIFSLDSVYGKIHLLRSSVDTRRYFPSIQYH